MKTVNGVITTSSTVLSVTCALAPVVPLPGGMFGPSTKIDERQRRSRVPIDASALAIRAPWLASRAPSDDIHEAVHVADRLHRAAEAVEEAGRARHEALPAVVARLARCGT